VLEPRHTQMLGFGFLFGGKPNEIEAKKISAKCGARVSAVRVCLQLNSGTACEAFRQDLDLCKVSSATPYTHGLLRGRGNLPVPSLFIGTSRPLTGHSSLLTRHSRAPSHAAPYRATWCAPRPPRSSRAAPTSW
jgi:hypothetical protein